MSLATLSPSAGPKTTPAVQRMIPAGTVRRTQGPVPPAIRPILAPVATAAAMSDFERSGDSSIGRLSEKATYSAKPTAFGSIQICPGDWGRCAAHENGFGVAGCAKSEASAAGRYESAMMVKKFAFGSARLFTAFKSGARLFARLCRGIKTKEAAATGADRTRWSRIIGPGIAGPWKHNSFRGCHSRRGCIRRRTVPQPLRIKPNFGSIVAEERVMSRKGDDGDLESGIE